MVNIGCGKLILSNGCESQVAYYNAENCEGCSLRSAFDIAKGNRGIDANYKLNFLIQHAKEKRI